MKIIRYAKLPLSFDAKPIQAELLASGGQWSPHLNAMYYTGSWDVLPLRSPGGRHDNPVPQLMNDSIFADTIYMERFPSVKKILESIKSPVMSARFLNLKAGAVIKEHRDKELAFELGEARLHFPVITNSEVEFYCEDERIILSEGECWYLNANLPHRVSNNGSTDRIHLVIDCEVDNWLREIMAESEIIAKKKQEIDPNIFKAIEYLRSQNTASANKHADEMEQRLYARMHDTDED